MLPEGWVGAGIAVEAAAGTAGLAGLAGPQALTPMTSTNRIVTRSRGKALLCFI